MKFRNKTILIIGGNSDVGKSLAKNFAKLGANLILTSRKTDQLKLFCKDIQIRYSIECESILFNVLNYSTHLDFYNKIETKPDIVITCIGYLDNQENSEQNFEEAKTSIHSNYIGLVSILNIIANDLEKKLSGTIVGISSVAGDRGRSSNYIYGSAKAAYTTYLSGLRSRMSNYNVKVLTVKPGFIKTKMTENLELPTYLTASPNQVALDIIKALRKSKNVIYTKWIWRYIMFIIKVIPENIFKNIKI